MSDPYLGQIMPIAWNYAPEGWALCNGQILQVSGNQALYAIIGNTFGGTAPSTFALPDLQGRVIVGAGNGAGLAPVVWGQKAGANQLQLQIANMPTHTHAAQVNDPGHVHAVTVPSHTHSFATPCAPTTGTGSSNDPNGNALCNTVAIQTAVGNVATDPGALNLYVAAGQATGTMAPGTTGPASGSSGNTGGAATGIAVANLNTGESVPVPIQPPMLGLYYIIATQGMFPVRQ